MYLWRNLPDGQLLAVLRWMLARRESRRSAAPAERTVLAEGESPLAPEPR